MKLRLNPLGLEHAKNLSSNNKIEKSAFWSFSVEDGDKLLGDSLDDWENYSRYHLAEDLDAKANTKERYKFPFGKDGKLYDKALRFVQNKAPQEIINEIDSLQNETRTDPASGLVFPFPKSSAKSVLKISAAKDNTYNMDMFGIIGGDWWGDGGITKEQFAKMLNDIPNTTQRVNLRMSSPGGDVFDGRAIANMMKEHKAAFDINIIAESSSIASVIAMAGDTIHMSEGAVMLVHRCYTLAIGNSVEMTKLAAELDKLDQTFVKTYMKRSNLSAEALISLMDENRYMDAEEAKTKGFVDTIDEETTTQDLASYKIAAYAGDDFRKKLHLPPLPNSSVTADFSKREAAKLKLQALRN